MSPVPQPPFPAELLADLHAGNIDPALSDQLWSAVRSDPDAQRYLESLDEVSESLAGLREADHSVHPMPADLAARLDDLAESLGDIPARWQNGGVAPSDGRTEPLDDIPIPAAGPDPAAPTVAAQFSLGTSGFPDTSAGPERADAITPISLAARRRRRLAATFAAAAAVLIAAAAALLVTQPERDTAPTAAPTTVVEPEPGTELDTAVALRALGRNDAGGRFADPAVLEECVHAAGIDSPVLGSTDMRFRNRDDAVLVLVGGRDGAQITALVVGPGCGPGNPEVLATTDIG